MSIISGVSDATLGRHDACPGSGDANAPNSNEIALVSGRCGCSTANDASQERTSPALDVARLLHKLKDMIRDLDAATIAAVAQLQPDAYGVAIRERVGELLGRAPSIGTIHLALTRLEREGLLRSRAGDPTPVRGGRAKRLFTVTAAGGRALERAQRLAKDRAQALERSWRPA
jgi:DNA-binding PadR family transcriptional regulator